MTLKEFNNKHKDNILYRLSPTIMLSLVGGFIGYRLNSISWTMIHERGIQTESIYETALIMAFVLSFIYIGYFMVLPAVRFWNIVAKKEIRKWSED